ncbi:MAG: XdhC family protein [Oscillospiraceae bacterium]
MVCGGDVTVWFQYIPPENAAQIGVLRAWRDALGSGRNVWLCLVLDGETLREFRLLTADELRHGTEGFFTSRPYWDGSSFVEPIVRAGRVYLFGAGHVGRALAPVLRYVGFEVTVYDNRAELASPAHFPTAHEIIVGDFRRIFDKVSLTADDYAVVMTPGHQADYEILEQVLRTLATYIGCIGSRKKVALTRERLAAAGFSQQDIDRVHAPIGLPILAETPEEIAISVAAEMIRHRAEHL